MMRLGISLKRQRPALHNADNLHRVAIARLGDNAHALTRWWQKKYRVPPKPLEEYTEEELYVEHLEDFYERNPKAMQDFLRALQRRDDWDGELPAEVERANRRRAERLAKRQNVDLGKYQTAGDADLGDEAVAAILATVGKNLPGSRLAQRTQKQPVAGPTIGEAAGEFDESFEAT